MTAILLSVKQVRQLYEGLAKYPEAQYIVIKDVENGSGIGPDTHAIYQDRGNLFRRIAPKVIGVEDITDVTTW